MVVLPERVFGDRFTAGRFSAAPYKIYAPRSSKDEAIHIQMAETAMRYDDPTCLVASAGRELWVFAHDVLASSETATGPAGQIEREFPEFKMVSADSIPEPPSQLDLVLVGAGVIHPRNIVNEAVLPRPWPFLAAIRARVLSQLCLESSTLRPFGRDRLIDADGSVVHVTPAVAVTGEIRLRLTIEKTGLLPVQGRDSLTVFLVPCGRQARLIDGFAPPAPRLARQFLATVQKLVCFYMPQQDLDESPWVRVAVDGRVIMWPASCVVSVPCESSGLGWLAQPDAYTVVGEGMMAIREALLNEKQHSQPHQPPKKAVASIRRILGHREQSTRPQPPPDFRPSNDDSASVSFSLPPPPPTPSATTSEAAPPPPQEPTIYPTPTDPSPARVEWTPAASEAWEEEDEEEDVTVADFSFFDDPINRDPAPASSPLPPLVPAEELVAPQAVVSASTSGKRNRSAFSPLEFVGGSIDEKYANGGRYFVTYEDEDEKTAEPQEKKVKREEDDDDDDEDDDDADALDENEADSTKPTDADLRMVEYWIHVLTGAPALPTPDTVSMENLQMLMAQVVWDDGMLGQLMASTPVGELEPISNSMASVIRRALPLLRRLPMSETGLERVSATPGVGTPVLPAEIDAMPQPSRQNSIGTALANAMASGSQQSTAALAGGSLSATPSGPATPNGFNGSSGPAGPNGGPSGSTSASTSSGATSTNGTNGTNGANNANVDRPQPTPPSFNTSAVDSFSLLSPPLYSVTRGDHPHKARAAILRFWKTFGLQPNEGPRDIKLILLTLASPRVYSSTRIHLQALQNCYQGCNLGKMELPTFGQVKNGVLNIAANPEYTNPDTVGDLFEASCSTLKRQLQEFAADTNVIIAMAFPPGPRTSPLPLARGFNALRGAMKNIRWVLTSIETFVSRSGVDFLPSQYSMVRRALLLYDRWVPHTNLKFVNLSYQTAFSLARLAPTSISIKFQPRPPAQILDEDPVMHVAYAVSIDKRWVAVAWTDHWGIIAKVEVFRLSGHSRTRASSPVLGTPGPDASIPDSPSTDRAMRNFDSVASEVWRRTAHICASTRDVSKHARWRVAIVKCGMLSLHELSVWRRMGDANWGSPAQMHPPYLLQLPTSRALNVRDGEVLFPHVGMTAGGSMTGPPASRMGTPNSPSAPSTPASTDTLNRPLQMASGSGRNDNVIVSALDETHGIVFENQLHILENSASATVTGVLVKPLIPAAFNGHQQVEIGLVHAPGVQHKQLMRQILGQYRRLASLSEYSGVNTEATILPWHVAGVNKMIAALGSL